MLSSVPSNFHHSPAPLHVEWEGGRGKAYRNVSNPGEKILVLCHALSLFDAICLLDSEKRRATAKSQDEMGVTSRSYSLLYVFKLIEVMGVKHT